MPVAVERKLKAEAAKKFPGDKKRQDRYIYGTMNKLNMIPPRKKIKKR